MSESKLEFLYRLQATRPAMLEDGLTPEESLAVTAHAAYLRQLAMAGDVLFFGRTQTTGPETFGIVVLRASSREGAAELMRHDPAVESGVMRADLFPFRIVGVSPSLAASA